MVRAFRNHCGADTSVRDGFGPFYNKPMRTYRTVVSLRDVGGNVPTATTKQLSEIMGFLKLGPGEPSLFEELFAERQRERQREEWKRHLLEGVPKDRSKVVSQER